MPSRLLVDFDASILRDVSKLIFTYLDIFGLLIEDLKTFVDQILLLCVALVTSNWLFLIRRLVLVSLFVA